MLCYNVMVCRLDLILDFHRSILVMPFQSPASTERTRTVPQVKREWALLLFPITVPDILLLSF